MTERQKLIETMKKTVVGAENGHKVLAETIWTPRVFEAMADSIFGIGAILPPCKVGDTVYKICPKCNQYHDGNCERCAWRGCFTSGCEIGVRIYSDGSNCEYALQIIPRKVLRHNIITIFEWWNIMYFATEEEAKIALAEYDAIRKTSDRHERYERYEKWEAQRETHYHFLEE